MSCAHDMRAWCVIDTIGWNEMPLVRLKLLRAVICPVRLATRTCRRPSCARTSTPPSVFATRWHTANVWVRGYKCTVLKAPSGTY
jgi:hypothetical protein